MSRFSIITTLIVAGFAWDVGAAGPGFVVVGADQTTAGTSMAAVWTSSGRAILMIYLSNSSY